MNPKRLLFLIVELLVLLNGIDGREGSGGGRRRVQEQQQQQEVSSSSSSSPSAPPRPDRVRIAVLATSSTFSSSPSLTQLPSQGIYQGQIADFGRNWTIEDEPLGATLMIPPGDPTMCTFPQLLWDPTDGENGIDSRQSQGNTGRDTSILTNNNNNNIFNQEQIKNPQVEDFSSTNPRLPIALLISRGGCSFDQKARVAIEIQRNITSRVQFLIVHNHNPARPNELVTMSTSNRDGLSSMRFLFVSYNSGNAILSHVQAALLKHQSLTSSSSTMDEATSAAANSPGFSNSFSPYLSLSPDSNSWVFSILMDPFKSQPQQNGGADSNDPGQDQQQQPRRQPNAARQTFHWLRFVLFSLLIISPCVRAGYLWYAAGGRLLIRRNEAGRFVGFQYVSPMPVWFTGHGSDSANGDSGSDENLLLTEEQVNALPEITFCKLDTMSEHSRRLLVKEQSTSATTTATKATQAEDEASVTFNLSEVDDDDNDNKNNINSSINDHDDKEQDSQNVGNKTEKNSHNRSTFTNQDESVVIVGENKQHHEGSDVLDDDSENGNISLDEEKAIQNLPDQRALEPERPKISTTMCSLVEPKKEYKLADDQAEAPKCPSIRHHIQTSGAITTTCTMCSICIEDFEEGEKIRVLPKCRHGFHKECIMPWLTERQGCCPLCKTKVLGEDGETNSAHETSDSVSTNNRNDSPA